MRRSQCTNLNGECVVSAFPGTDCNILSSITLLLCGDKKLKENSLNFGNIKCDKKGSISLLNEIDR